MVDEIKAKENITKAAAAVEIRKPTKLALILCVVGVVSSFIVALMANVNLILGSTAAAIVSAGFGYFGVKQYQFLKYLDKTYLK